MTIPDSRPETSPSTEDEVLEPEVAEPRIRLEEGHRPTGVDEAQREAERQRDEGLVRRAKAGDQDAFADILDAYQGRVERLVRRMFRRERETVEDLVQEVFLRVFRGLAGFEGSSAFGTWVHRIATNVCISEIRSRRALKRDGRTLSLDQPMQGQEELRIEPQAPPTHPGQELENQEMYAACRNAIEALPSMWRLILVLRDLEDKSYEDIAEILDLPIGTVRSRLHRARARVRRLLEGGGR